MKESNALWKWLYVGGVVVSGLAGAFTIKNDILGLVLIIVGILAGIFYFDPENFLNFGIPYLVLGFAAQSLSGLVAVGPFLTDFFVGAFTFLGPVALSMLVMLFWKKNI